MFKLLKYFFFKADLYIDKNEKMKEHVTIDKIMVEVGISF